MDITARVMGIALFVLMGIKLAPIFLNRRKNKKDMEGEFSKIEKSIEKGTDILGMVNLKYFKNKELITLIESGKIFARKAYLTSKLEERTQKNDFFKAIIPLYISFIFAVVVFVLELKKENIPESVMAGLKDVLIWVCGFFVFFFIVELALCYFGDVENKRDEAYKYELDVINKVLEKHMGADYAVDPQDAVSDGVKKYIVNIDGNVRHVTLKEDLN